MVSNGFVLILDLDGVLITTKPWQSDILDTDRYSAFNTSCVQNLNQLLSAFKFEIWLSSSRRLTKALDEFNLIFANRKVSQPIKNFVPNYSDCKSRKEEITKFITEFKLENYLIIDDDNSLNDLDPQIQKQLIKTNPFHGFNKEKYQEAFTILANAD